MNNKSFIAILSLLLSMLLVTAVNAATSSSNFQVLANVTQTCSIIATDLNFGSVNPLSNNSTDQTSELATTCTNGTPWAISLSKGSGKNYKERSMGDGKKGDLLSYNMYTDAAHNSIWGNGTTSTSQATGTGDGSKQNLTVYGQIPGGQTSTPAGSYSDSITATVTY